MFQPGDIVGFQSAEAKKHKFHLCISQTGDFVFLNTPKKKRRPADLYVSCDELPGIEPTETGESIISCSLVMQKTDVQLRSAGAKKKGQCGTATLKKIIAFVENNDVLTDDEKEAVIGSLSEWV